MSFTFIRDGVTYRVHTETGPHPARVIVEAQEREPEQMEPEDEA